MITVKMTKKNFPKYVKKAQKIQHICSGRFDKDGNMQNDIGIAILYGGKIIGIEWGGNLTLEQIRAERKADKFAEFAYTGEVWDGENNRSNFERIIKF